MNALIRSMKKQFAESTAIVSAVGNRCKFVVSLQHIKEFPVAVYNVREIDAITKDGSRDYDLTIFVMAKNIKDLLDLYEVSKEVMDTETTEFLSVFNGSSYPELLEEHDDIYIVDINYKITQ
jgi:hypothetical protein